MKTIYDITELDEIQWQFEAEVLKQMNLPPNCMTLDGDRVLRNSKNYNPTSEEMDIFAYKVKEKMGTIL